MDYGAFEEDGPGTWEAPNHSREGRPKVRETETEAEGDGESEGRVRAEKPGNG